MPQILHSIPGTTPGNATVTTTTELSLGSNTQPILRPTQRRVYMGWCQLTLGTATTTVTPRVRRGTLVTDPLIGEANAENIKTAAAQTEPFFVLGVEEVGDQRTHQMMWSVQQGAATGNGTAVQSGRWGFSLQ